MSNMQVEVGLFATLRIGRFNRRTFELAENASLRDVLRLVDIAEEEVAISLINGQHSKLDGALTDGDHVSLFSAVGGG